MADWEFTLKFGWKIRLEFDWNLTEFDWIWLNLTEIDSLNLTRSSSRYFFILFKSSNKSVNLTLFDFLSFIKTHKKKVLSRAFLYIFSTISSIFYFLQHAICSSTRNFSIIPETVRALEFVSGVFSSEIENW